LTAAERVEVKREPVWGQGVGDEIIPDFAVGDRNEVNIESDKGFKSLVRRNFRYTDVKQTIIFARSSKPLFFFGHNGLELVPILPGIRAICFHQSMVLHPT